MTNIDAAKQVIIDMILAHDDIDKMTVEERIRFTRMAAAYVCVNISIVDAVEFPVSTVKSIAETL